MYQQQRKYDYLLVLRGLCALAVVVCHYPFYLSELTTIKGLDWLLDPFGYVPVLIFFLLSGYLITLGFIEKRHDATIFSGVKKYYISRIFRIVPLYYLSIIICCAIYWERVTASPNEVLLLLPFIANYKSENGIIFNHVYWTMPVEMLYFLFAPFIYILLAKLIKKYGVIPLIAAVILIFVPFTFILFSNFPRVTDGIQMWRKDWIMTARCDFFYNLEAFILGGLCAFLAKKSNILEKISVSNRSILFIAIASILFLVFYTTTYSIVLLNEQRIATYFLLYGIIPAMALWFFLIVILDQNQSKTHSKLLLLGEKLGHMAYAIYLFHMPTLTIVESFKKAYSPAISAEMTSIIALIVTLIFSAFIYKNFEKPIMDMRKNAVKSIAEEKRAEIL
ncbi:acyltransferase family protein [Cellvibrio mixtus]|uniref:acyltransferase family protein n=1 Tax=Cellvibrio mixtus TaxID=39650 RepID=UPI000586A1F6|nr:acyltransferase [Cellvibrio mixtus]